MTTAAPTVTRSGLAIRTMDQGLWSLGFFVFNLAAGLSFAVGDFAALAVAAAIGFIAVGTSRAWGVYAAIVGAAKIGVAPERSIDRRSSWFGTLCAAAVAATVTFGWIARSGEWGFAAALASLAGVMVVSDLPRQVLIIRRRYGHAALLAGIYCAGGLLTAGVVAWGGGPSTLLGIWLSTLIVVFLVGTALCGSETNTARPESYSGIAWRITAEAVYLGVGSQIATLLLFLIQDDTATAGIRFAYSLVFAPAFVVIQSVQPLIFARFATLSARGTRAVIAVCVRWNVAITAGLGLCGFLGVVLLSSVLSDIGPSIAVPYVIPVGVAILSAQVFEVALMATRFFVPPELTHRARLASVLVDVGGQGFGVTVGGAAGLVWALVLLGALRVVVSIGMLIVLPRRDRLPDGGTA